jgi:hypothetical protein
MQKRTYKDYKKSQSHPKYVRKSSGVTFPGPTTYIKNCGWGKDALIAWAKREGAVGRDPELSKMSAAEIGNVTHYLIECSLTEREPDLGEYGPDFVAPAVKNLELFNRWAKRMQFVPEEVELGLCSEQYPYGGKLDLVGIALGEKAVFDIKTSKGIYEQQEMQVVAYAKLWEELKGEKLPVCFVHIYGGRLLTQWVEEERFDTLWKAFRCCMALEDCRKILGART